jgi:hypothetical protein
MWKDGSLPTGSSRLLIAAACLSAFVILSGCGEEHRPVVAPILPLPVISLTPDDVMTNFRSSYEDMDRAAYLGLLGPSFETHLLAVTRRAYPDVGETLDYAEETRIHRRMFAGEDLTDPNGGLVPAVSGLNFRNLEKLVGWGMSLASDPIPNTLSALYDIDLLVERGPDYPALEVRGQIRFYVEPVETTLNDDNVTYFRLVGQLDWTYFFLGAMAAEAQTTPWGTFKAYYR